MILPQVHLRNGEYSCGAKAKCRTRLAPVGTPDYILSPTPLRLPGEATGPDPPSSSL